MSDKSKKPITELPDDEAIKKLFPSKVVDKAKKAAREAEEKKARQKKKPNK